MSTTEPLSIDLSTLTVEKVQEGFRTRAFTAESLAEACFRQIDQFNGHYNAVIFRNDAAALADARAIDRRRAAGEPLGPLAGVPVVIKDPMDMVGFPTTAGWSLLCGKTGGVDLMPATDAPVVARLRAAGAILLGKTNVPVLSHTGTHADDSWAGPTLNVAMPSRVPGGSSAGTAAAVGAGMAVLGLAEETGGSIQNPASAQDLVGIKPTIGLVPNAGVMPLSANRDVVGPIARCVRDAALCLDVLAGYTAEDPKTLAGVGKPPARGYTAGLRSDALKGARLGLYGAGWRPQALSPETQALYARAMDELKAQGAVLVDDPFLGSGFAALRQPTAPLPNFDARGMESVPYDLQKYLERLGPDAALKSFDRVRAGHCQRIGLRSRRCARLPAQPAAVRGLPERTDGAAGPLRFHRAEGTLPPDRRRGVRARAARWAGVPADARGAAADQVGANHPGNHGRRNQHRRHARRGGAGRLPRLRRTLQPVVRGQTLERTGLAGLRVRL